MSESERWSGSKDAIVEFLDSNHHRTIIEFKELGKISHFYGDEFPVVYELEGGMLSHGGVCVSEGAVRQSTFFEVYRQREKYKNENQFYHERFSKNNRFYYDASADVVLENAVFCEHLWDTNYQHFLIETFPRIWFLCGLEAYRSFPIVVFDADYIRDLLGLCFRGRTFIFLNSNSRLLVTRRVVFSSAISQNFAGLPEIAIKALTFLRLTLMNFSDLTPPEGIEKPHYGYFGRRPLSGYAGNSRVITNLDELVELFDRTQFECVDFDGKTISQKVSLLSETKIAITPIGANLMNFIFAPDGVHLIIIRHPNFHQVEFFVRMYANMGIKFASVQIFGEVQLVDPSAGGPNVAYRVSAEALERVIHSAKLGRSP